MADTERNELLETIKNLNEQLRLFNEAEAEQDVKAPEPTEEILVAAHSRKRKRTMDELIQGLPVKETVIKIPEDLRTCDRCGGRMKPIGKKLAFRELEVIFPKRVFINEVYIETYACEDCEKDTGFANVMRAVTPERLLKHSLASPNTVADVMTQKYVDDIPLARQEKIRARDGIDLSRGTLANWVIQCAQRWLKPLYRQMKKALPESEVIHADETVVQVLKEPEKAPTSESRMWAYANGAGSAKPVRYFEYQPDRSGKHPAALLKDFTGCLVTVPGTTRWRVRSTADAGSTCACGVPPRVQRSGSRWERRSSGSEGYRTCDDAEGGHAEGGDHRHVEGGGGI